MTTTFELAPSRQRFDWELALAFSIVPTVVLFSTLFWFGNGLGVSLVAAGAAFLASSVMGLGATRARPGVVRLTEDRLVVESGGVEASVVLAELDLTEFSAGGPVDSADFNAITDASKALALHRKGGGTLRFSPAEPEEFVRALRATQST